MFNKKEYDREWRVKNREKINKYAREWAHKHKEKIRQDYYIKTGKPMPTLKVRLYLINKGKLRMSYKDSIVGIPSLNFDYEVEAEYMCQMQEFKTACNMEIEQKGFINIKCMPAYFNEDMLGW